ncbi:Ionotropic receptor 117 [Cephus cinctus]|nr:Ionotropic receptor 117 [Cephus cinctus]
MSQYTLIFLFVLLHIISGSFGTFKTSWEFDNSRILDEINILRSCFLNNFTTINLVGDAIKILSKDRDFTESRTFTLIGDTRPNYLKNYALGLSDNRIYKEKGYIIFAHKLWIFVVCGSSKPILQLQFQRIKTSMWWNHEGRYLIWDRFATGNSCRNAYPFLWTAWKANVIATVFLCVDPIEGPTLYTFNPYNEYFPKPWKEVARYEGRKGHPWILLKRPYRKGKKLCRDLIFDKTRTLDGYHVRVDAMKLIPTMTFDDNETGLDTLAGEDGMIIKELWRALNGTVIMSYERELMINRLGFIDPDGTGYGMLGDVAVGRQDMGGNSRYAMVKWNYELTQPHAISGWCILSKHRGYLTQVTKIISFFRPEIVMALFAVCLLTFIKLNVFLGQGFFPALLNILRIILAVSVPRLPKSNAAKIYLYCVSLLFLIFNAIFQGHMASLLTVLISNSNIDNFEDLKKNKLSLFGFSGFKEFIDDPEVLKLYLGSGSFGCVNEILKNASTGWLGDCLHLTNFMHKGGSDPNNKIHISPQIKTLAYSFAVRSDWPLFNRINIVIQRLREAGLIELWRKQSMEKVYFEVMVEESEKGTVKVLNISDLTFSFQILFIGYIVASITFILELLVDYRKRRNKVRSIKRVSMRDRVRQ